MNNLEKYNNAFAEVFGVEAESLHDGFSKENTDSWDSVHQLNIIAMLEDSFDIMFDPEDIMEFTSYGKGRELLKKYDVQI